MWAYALGVAALALACYPLLVGDYGPFTARELGAGAILLAASPAAELLVVHVNLRKNAHSFSLLELPLTAGILTANPALVVLAYSLGGAAVLLFHRKQQPLKLLFNSSQFFLTATLAVWIFHAVPHPGSPLSPFAWFAALIAVFTASSVGTGLVSGIISIAERRIDVRNLRRALLLGLATGAGGVSLGIACAILATATPLAVLFVTAPLIAVFLANRAYESERQRRENLQVVYDTTRMLSEEPESEVALFGALERCFLSLPGDFAAIHLPLEGSAALCLRVDDTGRHRTLEPVEPLRPILQYAATHGRAWRATAQTADEGTDMRSEVDLVLTAPVAEGEPSLSEVLVAPLMSESECAGLVIVGSYGYSYRHLGENELALFETVSRGIAAHTRLTRQANEDALTRLPNRRVLMERLHKEYESGAGSETALLLIDLDDFKTINDTFGHGVGDEVLIEVARRLLAATSGATVARLGGDEFAVVGAGGEWARLGEAALRALSQPLVAANHTFAVRVSIGAALAGESEGPAALVRNADTALYEAKRLGKGQMRLYNGEMRASVVRRYTVAEALRTALARDETSLAIQPIVNMSDGRVIGGEALSRWENPTLGTVSPLEFVRIAEEHGLSSQLSKRVLAKVVVSLKSVAGALKVTMNVSPGDLADLELVSMLQRAARAVAPHILGVEITERMLLSDPAVFATLGTLRESGIAVAIDDFGTGYSSLAYLKDMPADCLKIPREFVRDVGNNERSLAVVQAVVAVGKALGLAIVAEGVETEQQQRILEGLGVSEAQGFLFSPALTAERFFHGDDHASRWRAA